MWMYDRNTNDKCISCPHILINTSVACATIIFWVVILVNFSLTKLFNIQ
jgi:hypothetical protein